MKTAIVLVLAAVLVSGCCSTYTVMSHNTDVRTQAAAVRLRALPNGAAVEADLLNLTGYWGAWKAQPVAMTTSTIVDALIGVGAGVMIDKEGWFKGGSHDTTTQTTTPVSRPNGMGDGNIVIGNNSGDIHINYGNTGTP